jgi:S1-C subfamily serine protease
MSLYDSEYDHDSPRRRAPAPVWPFLAFLALLGVVLGGLVYLLWPEKFQPAAAPVTPRLVEARGDLASDEKGTIDLFRAASPSVVNVTNLAEQRDFFNLNVQQIPRGTGTGFVWDRDGHIVTNFHVVRGGDAVRVVFADGSSYISHAIWAFPDKDLAVVRIRAPQAKLTPIPLGTSADLQVGQKALAIGNPFGLNQSLSTGVVSALGREIEAENGRPISGLIQTTAAINPGNSGGPLLDSAGRLIGVTTAILSPSGTWAGIGFAIPVDEVNQVVPQLIAHHKVVRPRLGVRIAEADLARQVGVSRGVLIVKVLPGSPAQKSGLHGTRYDENRDLNLGDIIVGVDGKTIQSSRDLFALLEKHKPGETVNLTILREGQSMDVPVTLEAGD